MISQQTPIEHDAQIYRRMIPNLLRNDTRRDFETFGIFGPEQLGRGIGLHPAKVLVQRIPTGEQLPWVRLHIHRQIG